jgi:aminoglycoside phosphotransferase (APT) family kinase protein
MIGNRQDLRAVAYEFLIDGDFTGAVPYGNGHINDTYCVTFQQAGAPRRFILQRINSRVFKNPPALMENIHRVTTHLGLQVRGDADAARRVLTLIPTRDGAAFHVDASGNYWRTYLFIEGSRTYEAVESPEQAYQAASAFGHFQRLLVDLPLPRLHDTIPDFHHTPKRLQALQHAISADAVGRAASAKAEIDFALAHESITGALLRAGLPERVTHNDTKLNNVMIDDATGEGICVIDLDTVMPGLAAYDFGDMVRTATSPAGEDEQDLAKVVMQFPMFEALARGYIASAGRFLTKEEKGSLAFGGKLITLEIGMRFVTDYLMGDKYFKIKREGHNLDRCRTQFKLVESIEQQEDKMNRLIDSIEL